MSHSNVPQRFYVYRLMLLTTLLVLPQLISAKSLSTLNDDGGEIQVLVIGANGADEIVDKSQDVNSGADVVEQKPSSEEWRFADTQVCNIYENEPLHALMDRICELCHEMFSHEKPNMRAECRADCFRSDNFKSCLRLFKPANRRQTRNKHRRAF